MVNWLLAVKLLLTSRGTAGLPVEHALKNGTFHQVLSGVHVKVIIVR